MAKRTSKRGSSKKADVPLRWRLPNPPPLFVNREDERSWLTGAIERGPVSVVSGPGGVGKTALVRHTLDDAFPRKLRRVIHVQVPPAEPVAQVRLQVLRALTESRGLEVDDWGELQVNPDELLERVLDAAEGGSYWFVIDDLYQEEIAEADELLVWLATYVRKSRWIITSRWTPQIRQMAGQVLTLGVLDHGSLVQLARAWTPGLADAEVQAAVADCAGSPWVLYQRLSGPVTPHGLDGTSLLSGLSAAAMSFVQCLAVFEVPMPMAVLSAVMDMPHEGDLDVLLRRGLIDGGPAGLRLHDVARGLIRAEQQGERFHAMTQTIVDRLVAHDAPEAQLEAVRLLALTDRAADLASLLDAGGAVLISHGYAPRLWSVLRGTEAPELHEWRLKCAAELGNPTALAQVRAPKGSRYGERLAWARTLLAEGDMEGSLEVLDELVGSGPDSHNVHAEGVLLRAEALRRLGRHREAHDVLLLLTDLDGPLRARRDAALSLFRISIGGNATEVSTLVRIAGDGREDPELSATVAEVLVEEGRLDEALQVVDGARSTPRGTTARLLSARRLLLVAARIALLQGRLEESKLIVDQVRPYARGASLLLPEIHVLESARRLVTGELAELAPRLEAWQAEVRGVDAEAEVELVTSRLRLGLLMAEPVEESSMVTLSTAAPAALRHRSWSRLITARIGEGLAFDEEGSRAERSELTILDGMAMATWALTHGDVGAASARIMGVEREAERRGLGALRAEVLCIVADVLLFAGRLEELASTAELLAHLSARMGSPRFELEAQFYAMVAAGRPHPALLEWAASAIVSAPVAARRAQALLSGRPHLDLVDVRLLEALTGSRAIPTIETVSPAIPQGGETSWWPGWGLDDVNGCVWFEDGTSVELDSRSLTWRILDTLIRHGGSASKEQLVQEAWGEGDYHPLRHDGKVHVAIRKVREQILDTAAVAARLLTTEDGYMLGGVVRRAR